MENKPKNYRLFSWLVLLFANLIIGAIALYFSYKTDDEFINSNITEAKKASRSTLLFVRLGFIVGIVTIILGSIIFSMTTYNSLVSKEEVIKQRWSNVQSDYQRRSDLIPNLVSTVKGEANFEQQTLNHIQKLANARRSLLGSAL